ncbi:DnaB-like helicase C-terminal domain-containing protein [Clostridium tertium]|uniref:DnaB-like helicase C-terminal domain-containing protein n=1 Tax=Clostridium tertium TaxID=1559 RepID=UPI0023B2DFE5|nr:DnaB-like helicase C-terminal domain-containing protein [Clostridium tertium]
MAYSEETLELLSDMYAYCTPTDNRSIEECNLNHSKLVTMIDNKNLSGEYHVLDLIYERYYFLLNESGTKDILKDKHLETIIMGNGKKLIRSKYVDFKSIKLDFDSDMASLDPDYERECINELYSACLDKYNDFKTREPESSFVDTIEEYKMKAEKDEITQVLHSSLDILFKGKQVGKEYMYGTDVKDYLKTEVARIESRYLGTDSEDDCLIDSYTSLRNILDNAGDSYKRVTDVGIAPIDEAFSDLHTGQILTITGSPGAGKSRLTHRIIYRARVLDKKNCYIWSGEMGRLEITAIQLGSHCWNKFGVYIDDKMIKYHYETDPNKKVQKDLVLTESDIEVLKNAELDFARASYGKLYTDDKTLFVEDFEAKMMYLKKKMNLDLFVIDYLLLLSSNGKNPFNKVFNKTEMLEYMMDKAKRCAKEHSMLGIVLNQLDKATIKSILAGNNADTTASKYSSAPVDFADFNIVISSDESLYAARKVKFHCPKVRSGRRYKAFIADENAGVCDYKYLEDNSEEDEI